MQDSDSVPGDLYDVGGRRLYLRALGSGRPTVILEAGLGCSACEDDAVSLLLFLRFGLLPDVWSFGELKLAVTGAAQREREPGLTGIQVGWR